MTATGEAQTAADFVTLRGKQYINLTTFRKNGTPVVTPVWFAEEGDRLYVMTEAETGKVKRVRNNDQVLVALSSARGKALGPTMPGTARLLPDSQATRVETMLNRKYGLIKRGFELLMVVAGLFRRGNPASRVYLEIAPAA